MKPEKTLSKKVKAYTLTEILVVLCIIGILVLLALPNLLPLITRAKSMEAKEQLGHVQELEQNYFYEHSKYSKDLTEIGFIQDPLTTDGKNGRANYRIEISAQPTPPLPLRQPPWLILMVTVHLMYGRSIRTKP